MQVWLFLRKRFSVELNIHTLGDSLGSNPEIINDDGKLAIHSNRSWIVLIGLDLATPVVDLVSSLLTFI